MQLTSVLDPEVASVSGEGWDVVVLLVAFSQGVVGILSATVSYSCGGSVFPPLWLPALTGARGNRQVNLPDSDRELALTTENQAAWVF